MPIDNCMYTHCFVDSNYDGDTETRRSQTGIVLLCKKTAIMMVQKEA